MAKSIPWDKMRDEYTSSESMSYADLAKKYGTSLDAVKKRASKEKWAEKRHQVCTQIALKTTEKTIELVSDERAQINAEHYRIWGMVLDKLKSALAIALDIGEIETLTRALDRAHKGQRLAKEMDKKQEEQSDAAPEWARQIFGAGGIVQPAPVRPAQGTEGDSPEPEPV